MIIHTSASIVLIMMPINSTFPYQNVDFPRAVTLTCFICLCTSLLRTCYIFASQISVCHRAGVQKLFGKQINDIIIFFLFNILPSLSSAL